MVKNIVRLLHELRGAAERVSYVMKRDGYGVDVIGQVVRQVAADGVFWGLAIDACQKINRVKRRKKSRADTDACDPPLPHELVSHPPGDPEQSRSLFRAYEALCTFDFHGFNGPFRRDVGRYEVEVSRVLYPVKESRHAASKKRT